MYTQLLKPRSTTVQMNEQGMIVTKQKESAQAWLDLRPTLVRWWKEELLWGGWRRHGDFLETASAPSTSATPQVRDLLPTSSCFEFGSVPTTRRATDVGVVHHCLAVLPRPQPSTQQP